MKKLPKLLICLGLTGSILFTGCSLVQRNSERYLNRTVASCGEITVSKQELLNAYNSYGYQYVQNYGYTAEKAVSTLLDELLNNKIILQEAKKYIKVTDEGVTYFADGDETGTGVKLFNKNVWQNAVWNDTFESVNSQISTLADTIREELDIEKDKEAEETDPEFKPFEEYEKKVEYDNGTWSLVNKSLAQAEEKQLSIGDFVQDKNGNSEIEQKAFKRYIKKIVLNYKDKNLKKSDLVVSESEFDNLYADLDLSEQEKIAFLYELDRIHTFYEERKYTTEFESAYGKYNQTLNDEFNKSVVTYYKNLVLGSYQKYASLTEEQAYKAYFADMQSDPSKVYYHGYKNKSWANTEKGFATIAHVLIKITDEQKAELSALDNLDLTKDEYESQKNALIQKFMSETFTYARDSKTGLDITDTKYSVNQIYDEINKKLSESASLQDKAEAFNEFIYKYGQDSGSINASHYYACNMYTDDSGDFADKLVKEFADTSRKLAKEAPQGGNWAEPVFVNQSNYAGFHIIFNLGIYQNQIVGDLTKEQIDKIDSTTELANSYALKLYNTRIMLGVDKSYYDEMYDKLSSSNYTSFTNSLTQTAKQNLKVTYYVDAYKDLY